MNLAATNLQKMNTNSQTVLITGASNGIGYELAKLCARHGHNLILVARSAKKLNQVSAELQTQFRISAKTIPLDLATAAAPKFLFDQLQRESVAVDILINNAGYGAYGDFAAMPEDEILGQIQLNLTTLTHLTRLFLPPMLARRSGKIMNVASTAAFQPGPLMAVYYASKAYVLSFSEAIANEVARTASEVTVTCFCPGATDTGFAKRAGTETSRLFKQLGAMDTATVARDGYRGLMAGKTVVISGARNWLVAESVRFAPRKMVTAISRWVAEKVDRPSCTVTLVVDIVRNFEEPRTKERQAKNKTMPTLIPQATRIQSAGNKPKLIDEYVGRVNTKTSVASVAHMRSPAGWLEPGQTPEFDEFTIVLKGTLRVEHRDADGKPAKLDVSAGQAVIAHAGEWVRYSTPDQGGAEYIAVCLPAFSVESVHRDAR